MASVREHSASVMGWWSQCDRIMDAPSDAGVKHRHSLHFALSGRGIRLPETFTYAGRQVEPEPS